MRRLRRLVAGGAPVVMAVVLVAGIAQSTGAEEGAEETTCARLAPDALLKPVWLRRQFLRLAFVGGHLQEEKQRLERWNGAIGIAARTPPPWFAAMAADLARTVSCATAMPVSVVPTTSPERNITVYFDDDVPLPDVEGDSIEARGGMAPAGCTTLYDVRRDSDVLANAAIYISARRSQEWQRHCLLQGMLHALGLAATHDLIDASVLRRGGPPFSALPPNDLVMLRILYDPRLEAGMPRADVEARLEAVIADAVHEVTAPR